MGNDKRSIPRQPMPMPMSGGFGITGEFTMLDPWRFAWEFTYGSSTWSDDDALNRQGMDGRSFDGISRQLGYSRHLRLVVCLRR